MASWDDESTLVYSSESGMAKKPQKNTKGKGRGKGAAAPPQDGVVRVSRQTKGRKGKGVTLITGISLDAAGLKDLGKKLKQLCGSGGTVKDGIIEVQGDHIDTLVAALKDMGWPAKRSGG
jgi:translation initiation factor 1